MLIEAGHHGACHYPIGMMMDEAALVDDRIQARLATTALLNQMAISTMPVELSKAAIASAKKSAEQFQSTVKAMLGEP